MQFDLSLWRTDAVCVWGKPITAYDRPRTTCDRFHTTQTHNDRRKVMQHNLKLNDDAATTVLRALEDIRRAIDDARAAINNQVGAMSARDFDRRYADVRACLGSIGDAQWRIDQIVFHTDLDDSDYAIDTSAHPAHGRRALALALVAASRVTEMVCPTCDDDLPGCPIHDEAPPHGIERPRLYGIDCAEDCSCKGGK